MQTHNGWRTCAASRLYSWYRVAQRNCAVELTREEYLNEACEKCACKSTLNISKPKMSNTPMKRLLSEPGFVHELIWLTIQLNVREYSAFAIACLFSLAYTSWQIKLLFWVYQYNVLTSWYLSAMSVIVPRTLISLIVQRRCTCASDSPSKKAIFLVTSLSRGVSWHVSFSVSWNFRFPIHKIAEITLNIPVACSGVTWRICNARQSSSNDFLSSTPFSVRHPLWLI